MSDPRLVLSDELQSLGVNETLAAIIALDAGSSQAVVDEEYLKSTIEISENYDIKQVLEAINKFYSGAMFDD